MQRWDGVMPGRMSLHQVGPCVHLQQTDMGSNGAPDSSLLLWLLYKAANRLQPRGGIKRACSRLACSSRSATHSALAALMDSWNLPVTSHCCVVHSGSAPCAMCTNRDHDTASWQKWWTEPLAVTSRRCCAPHLACRHPGVHAAHCHVPGISTCGQDPFQHTCSWAVSDRRRAASAPKLPR